MDGVLNKGVGYGGLSYTTIFQVISSDDDIQIKLKCRKFMNIILKLKLIFSTLDIPLHYSHIINYLSIALI